MHKNAASKLIQKGWSKAELNRAADIIAHAEESKSASMHFVEKLAFWVTILVAILGNLIISVVMVPFLLLLSGAGLYFTVLIIGFTFGILFNVIIHYMEDLGEGQHIIAGAFIPALALINIYIIAHFSNKLEAMLMLQTPAHSPFAVSITYVIAFVLPYLLKHFRHIKEHRL